MEVVFYTSSTEAVFYTSSTEVVFCTCSTLVVFYTGFTEVVFYARFMDAVLWSNAKVSVHYADSTEVCSWISPRLPPVNCTEWPQDEVAQNRRLMSIFIKLLQTRITNTAKSKWWVCHLFLRLTGSLRGTNNRDVLTCLTGCCCLLCDVCRYVCGVHVCVNACVHTCMCACVNVSVHACVCVCVCDSVYMFDFFVHVH